MDLARMSKVSLSLVNTSQGPLIRLQGNLGVARLDSWLASSPVASTLSSAANTTFFQTILLRTDDTNICSERENGEFFQSVQVTDQGELSIPGLHWGFTLFKKEK